MTNTYDLQLSNGKSEKLTFSFRFIVIASQLMEDKERFPLSLDDTLKEAAKIVDNGLKFSELNRLMTLIYPFVFAGIQASIEADKSTRILIEEDVKSIINNIDDVGSVAYILGFTFNSIAPKGLPQDKGKKKAPAKKMSSSGRK